MLGGKVGPTHLFTCITKCFSGLLTNLKFAFASYVSVDEIQQCSRAIVPSRAYSSNRDDDTVLASLQVVRTLQRNFN